MRNFFTPAEVMDMIGKKVRLKRPYGDLPRGTIGTVVRPPRPESARLLLVQWDLPEREKPLRHWFDRNEFVRFLEVVDERETVNPWPGAGR